MILTYYIILCSRRWWIQKCVELILAATTTRRLSTFNDTKLIEKLPTFQLIKILNSEPLLLARRNVQNRVMKILNSKQAITDRNDILPETDQVKHELINYVSQLNISAAVAEIHNMNVGRLMSLIHAFTGEIPTLCSTMNEIGSSDNNTTDDQDSPLVLTETQNPVSKR